MVPVIITPATIEGLRKLGALIRAQIALARAYPEGAFFFDYIVPIIFIVIVIDLYRSFFRIVKKG